MTRLRDFVYLDVERLYSLYSQIFEGVTEKVVETFFDSLMNSNRESSFLKGASFQDQVIEVSQRTENKFLFDHMFNQVEEKMKESIVDGTEITTSNLNEKIFSSPLIKITGKALFMDFNRFTSFTDDFEEMAEALIIVTQSAQFKDVSAEIKKFERYVQNATDKNQKAGYEKDLFRARVKLSEKIDEIRKQSNMFLDPQVSKSLAYLTKKFYMDSIEVIFYSTTESVIGFRGILNKKWLRLDPAFLRTLFGSKTSFDITLLGQVTYVNRNEKEDSLHATLVEKSMRDFYEDFIENFRDFEKITSQSNKRTDLIIWPIALYRESEI